jgi:hypothetical protein
MGRLAIENSGSQLQEHYTTITILSTQQLRFSFYHKSIAKIFQVNYSSRKSNP